MAWTTPRDWTDDDVAVPNGIVTAAMLNTDIRDNLLVLSTHTHTGAAGMGAASMSGLTLTALGTLTFADQSANPDAAGELQRNGNDLLWYGSSVVNLTAADASAGTASLRTLGTTSVKAAAGDHTHVPASQAVGATQDGYATISNTTETTIATLTATPGAAGRSWICYGAFNMAAADSTINTTKLKFDAEVLQTRTGLTGAGGAPIQTSFILAGIKTSPAVSSHTVSWTITRTSGAGTSGMHGSVGFREVSA